MIELTVMEQRRANYWRRPKDDRPSPRVTLRESDELMFWLEECHVQGLKMVPGWLMPRLFRVLARADAELPRLVGGERRPQRLMEILYNAQERLMEQSNNLRLPAKIVPLFTSKPR